MIKKIQTALIHFLGGVTKAESEANAKQAELNGIKTNTQSILKEMERINGVDADQWCKHMYQSVKLRMQRLESNY